MMPTPKSVTASVVAALLMVSASAAAVYMTPRVKIADRQHHFELAQIIPATFGDWQIDSSIVPLQVDPETQARLDRIYNQTLSRTYVNKEGERVMLSIAYGGDQSSDLAVHLPETCYGAQGFDVQKSGNGEVATPFGVVPVKHLYAVAGERREPITYWITVGDRALQPGMSQRLQRLRYGLTGAIADAMLVRVSTLDGETDRAYQLQAKFVNDLLRSLKPQDRIRIVGTFPT